MIKHAKAIEAIKRYGSIVGLTVGLMLPLIPSCDSSDGPCVEGEACVCEADCAEACDGAGCGFTCEAGVSCDFECEGGGCGVTCDPGSDCSLSCPGGACSMTCSADASCHIQSCDGGSCSLACSGSDDCSNACGLEQGCVST